MSATKRLPFGLVLIVAFALVCGFGFLLGERWSRDSAEAFAQTQIATKETEVRTRIVEQQQRCIKTVNELKKK